ncbi:MULTISPECIES: HlyD family secretion protein [unclassified Methylobacterium]|uniref:HlyD family secretion protein n=1 Tax=unclassified Methylobacterium TaxID=2615210 RepID=UPI0008A7D8E5|nr:MULTISPECIES: HlyD family secretion protein [unclassified Methylobacterium]SEH31767.1 membrane fusion protein, multidrug efflux system [Methylobacterium sp. 275MFSha3.1]SFS71045.1 membrane fusion protein, multidrug efflux system [Methylobacterium sp. yr668]
MDARRSDSFKSADPVAGAPVTAPTTAAVTPPVSAPVPATVSAPAPRRRRARIVLPLLGLLALGGTGTYGWHWWSVGRFLEVTDDAYLQSDKVTVAPRIAGTVAAVLVGDNQPVKAGDVIARLDDRSYRVQLRQAEAEVEKDRAQILGVASAIVQQRAQVASSRADLANAEAALTFAQQEYTRYQNLLQTGSGTVQRQQQAESDLRQRHAARDKAAASLDAAQKQIDSLKALEASTRASLEGAQAKVEGVRLDLSYTTIVAPIDGVAGDRALRIGQVVSAGTGLLTLVPMGRDIYLVANFKETQTGRMVEGQRVTFTVDAFGDHAFRGRIESFSPGTGSQFALLPPENATGNFTKVVQRVPVRVALDPSDPLIARLRPGLSVEATVHTQDPVEPVRPARPRPAPALVSEALPR